MTIDKNTPYGDIDISLEAISLIAGNAASECYGVVGLADRRVSDIIEAIQQLLKREEYRRGIRVKKTNKGFEVDVFIIVAYGVKITEVVSEVQKKVKYDLVRTFDLNFLAVNVYVQGLKEI